MRYPKVIADLRVNLRHELPTCELQVSQLLPDRRRARVGCDSKRAFDRAGGNPVKNIFAGSLDFTATDSSVLSLPDR